MFFPYTSEIEIKRSDTQATSESRLRAQKRNSSVAIRVVLKDLLKKPKSNKRAIAVNEKDIRLAALMPVIEEWNTYARRYSSRDRDWTPKTKSQLTLLERIISMCNLHEIQIGLLFASCFIAYQHRKHPLTLQIVLTYGLEYYNSFSDQAASDMDEEVSQSRSYGFGFK